MRFVQDEAGAAAVEYALMASLVALAIVGSVGVVGRKVYDMYVNVIAASLPN